MNRKFLGDSRSMYRTTYGQGENGEMEYGFIIFDKILYIWLTGVWCGAVFDFTQYDNSFTRQLCVSVRDAISLSILEMDTGYESDIAGKVKFKYCVPI